MPQLPNASGPPVTLAIAAPATPVPVSETGEPVTVAPVPVMVTEPVAAPAAVGLNRTKMVQFAPAFRVAAQVPPFRLKGAVTVIAVIGKAAVPVLESVNVWLALFVLVV